MRQAGHGSKPLLVAAAAVALTLVLGVALAGAVAPAVSVEDATNVQYTTAAVKGHVNPEGQSTSWRFQYATAADFSNAQDGPSGTTETAKDVSGTLSGLQPDTTYHLRLVAENADGPSEALATNSFETKAVAKPTVTIEEVTTFTSTTAHFVGHVNPNAPEAAPASAEVEEAFKTQWEFQCTPQDCHVISRQCTPECSGASNVTPASNLPYTVEVDVDQLEPNTPFPVKLVAFNLGGKEEAQTTASPSFTTPAAAPVVNWPHFGRGSDTTAHVGANVNPRNSALTSCKVEYGTSPSYGQSVSCTAPLASGGKRVEASADLSGLSPETEYHFRLVAENASGVSMSSDGRFTTFATPETESCSNESLRTEQHASFLPDCRAYEMVSPPDKNGADVIRDTTQVRADIAGEALAYSSLGSFGDAVGGLNKTEYMARRGEDGWLTHAITPPQQPLSIPDLAFTLSGSGYQAEFSDDLSKGLFRAKSPLTEAPNVSTTYNAYLRDDLLDPGPGHYRLIDDATTPQSLGGVFTSYLSAGAGASADFSHILFESERNLTDDAVSAYGSDMSQRKLYLWRDGAVELVGKVPPPGETACGASGPACVIAPASGAGRGALSGYYIDRAISEDGSRIAFVVSGGCNPLCGKLYLRDDHGTPGSSDDETVALGLSERTDCADHDPCSGDPEPDPAGTQPLTYWNASADTGLVFFTTTEQLTDDDHDNVADLYRWDLNAPAGQQLTQLSVGNEPSDGDSGGEIRGVLGTSEDGSYVYFASYVGQLVAGGPTGQTGGFSPNGVRIFVWHDGAIHEVGAVGPGVEFEYLNGDAGWGYEPRWFRIAPDGTHVAFVTTGTDELTGYTHGSCPLETSIGVPICTEVYLYDATANGGEGKLSCASCRPGGASSEAAATFVPHYVGTASATSHLNHALSDDGRYVFFTSRSELVPEDINGAKDAYSYDSVTGKVHLLSTGNDDSGSFFLDATPDGHDAYVGTYQRLSSRDVDQNLDLYDVRIGGGFAEPAPPPTICSADSCQGAQAQAPSASSPQSNRATGNGNVEGRRKKQCAKGRRAVKRHGRTHCAKRNRNGRAGK